MAKRKEYDLLGNIFGNSKEVLEHIKGYHKEYSIYEVVEDTATTFLLMMEDEEIENHKEPLIKEYLKEKHENDYTLSDLGQVTGEYYKELITENFENLVFNYAYDYIKDNYGKKIKLLTDKEIEDVLNENEIDEHNSLECIQDTICCYLNSLEVLVKKLLEKDLNTNTEQFIIYKAENTVGTIYTYSFKGVDFIDDIKWEKVCDIGGSADIDYNECYILQKIEE